MKPALKNFMATHKISLVITVIFLLVVMVFGESRISETIAIRHRIKVMQREQMMYRERSKADSTFLENLKHDWFLEKYARETFYMKAPDEEIYLLD